MLLTYVFDVNDIGKSVIVIKNSNVNKIELSPSLNAVCKQPYYKVLIFPISKFYINGILLLSK